MSEIELAKKVMEETFPGRPITTSNLKRAGGRAHLELVGASSVRFAYLNVGRESDPSLRLFPADTLSQARIFYGDPDRARELMVLESRDWKITPNFHFGFMNKGLVWTKSKLPPSEYIDYWTSHIGDTRIIQRPEWDSQLEEWIRDGIFDEASLPLFQQNFHQTKRAQASPRPGLKVVKPLTQPLAGPTVKEEIRENLREAMGILKEPFPG